MKRCCLVVGHEPPPYPPNDPGAVSRNGSVNEWEFNNTLSDDIIERLLGTTCLDGLVVDVVKVLRDPDGYNRLPGQINALRPDYCVSMHLNGYALPSATGTEVLYWHTSKKGRQIAATFIKHLEPALGLRLRGDNGLVPIAPGGRGGRYLGRTKAPAVLVEPGFVTSPSDLNVILRNREKLVKAYVQAIKESAINL